MGQPRRSVSKHQHVPLIFLAAVVFGPAPSPLPSPVPTQPTRYILPPKEFDRTLPQPEAEPVGDSGETTARSDETDGYFGPVLENIDGAVTLQIKDALGNWRASTPSEQLRAGETVKTEAGVSARLAYEDGTQVLINNETQVKVRAERLARGQPHVSSLELEAGQIRVLVPNGANFEGGFDDDEDEEKVPKRPPPTDEVKSSVPFRFLVRTKSSVIGVRGTDFVVTVGTDSVNSSDISSVHTFSGLVEIAQDYKSLRAKKGIAVQEAYFSEAFGDGRGIDKAQKFEMAAYLKELHEKNPKLESLWRQAKRDRQSGRLKNKFQRLRDELTPKRAQEEEIATSAGSTSTAGKSDPSQETTQSQTKRIKKKTVVSAERLRREQRAKARRTQQAPFGNRR